MSSFAPNLADAIYRLQQTLKEAGLEHGALEIRLATESDGRRFEYAVRMDPNWRLAVPWDYRGPIEKYEMMGVKIEWPKTQIALQARAGSFNE